MKFTGQCFKAFPEFPVLPFDPAVFGFTEDLSDPTALRQCPCFAAGDRLLWWNWPRPQERELYAPLARYFITQGPANDLDAAVLFEAETLADLVGHLIATPYASPRPILEGACDAGAAAQFLAAIAAAGVLQRPSGDLASALRRDALGSPAAAGATAYLRAIGRCFGDQAPAMVLEAMANVTRLIPDVE